LGALIGGIVALGLICSIIAVVRKRSRDGKIPSEEQIGPYETIADKEQI
jgi:hypothetical protein